MSRDLDRFLGGSPLSVAVRLILLSIVVGVILTALGFSPFDIVASIREMVRRIYSTGFDAVRWAWGYFLLGAVIVVPVFVLMRLVRFGRRERSEA
jgi:hypothetical protein